MSSHEEIQHTRPNKQQFQCAPSIEMFYDKNKMCCRIEFELIEGIYKLNFLNAKSTSGKIGFEFISETTVSKKQILDTYFTNNVVNMNVSQNGKLIIRFLCDIPLDICEMIESVYCIPNHLHEKYYSDLPKQTSMYFTAF